MHDDDVSRWWVFVVEERRGLFGDGCVDVCSLDGLRLWGLSSIWTKTVDFGMPFLFYFIYLLDDNSFMRESPFFFIKRSERRVDTLDDWLLILISVCGGEVMVT